MAECFHGHILAKGQLGRELLGAFPERLPFLGAIYAVESDLFSSRAVHHRDGVTVQHANDSTSKISGQ